MQAYDYPVRSRDRTQAPDTGRGRVWPDSDRDSPTALDAIRILYRVVTDLHSKLHLSEAMRAVSSGVVEATCFNAAAINLRLPSGDLEAVAVEGPQSAIDAVLGTVQPVDVWHRMLREGERIAGLVYVDHDSPLGRDLSIPGWTPPTASTEDEEMWHPLDML